MYFFLFILLRKNFFVNGQQCCNRQVELIVDNNSGNFWNTEFTSDTNYLEDKLKLFSFGHLYIDVYVKEQEQEQGIQCVIHHGIFQQIIRLELGAFQQVFIKGDLQNVELFWYQDFELIYEKIFQVIDNVDQIINNNQKWLCRQMIPFKQIDSFQQKCQEEFNLNIKMNPLLKELESLLFNNNFYGIQFWIKQIRYYDLKSLIDIYIHGLNPIFIDIYHNQTLIVFDEFESTQIEKQEKDVWNFYQITYLRTDSIMEYQTLNTYKAFKKRQLFQQIKLHVIPKNEYIIFTGVQLNLKKKSLNILCPPGCLNCNQQGYCIKCEKKLLNGFCECEENFYFFISPSECYVQVDKQLKIVEKQQKIPVQYLLFFISPTFRGLECLLFQNEIQGEIQNYCLYKTNITFQNKQIELEQNVYYLFVAYELVDDQYQIVSKELDKYYYHNLNIIRIIETKYDLYLIGETFHEYKICQKQYYHLKKCQQMNKQCLTQQIHKYCLVCQDFYFLQNGQCSKGPDKCKQCQIFNKQLICLSCIKMFFLNFQRKCIPCLLESCELCYHYNGQLNTLERYFKIQARSFLYKVGCSYCQNSSTLNLFKRICIQENEANKLSFLNKTYVSSEVVDKLLINISANCGLHCRHCFDICFLCDYNFYLDIEYDKCRLIIDPLDEMHVSIYNKQSKDQLFSLVTIIFQNYNFSQIIQNKYQYFFVNCELLYQNEKDLMSRTYCKTIYYNSLNKQCQFYCDKCFKNQTCIDYKYDIRFNVNFTMIRLENQLFLVNDNNYFFNQLDFIPIKSQIQYQITINFDYFDGLQLSAFVQKINYNTICFTMQFNNILIFYELLDIYFQEFLIQYSNIQIVDLLAIRSDYVYIFSMLNVSLKGEDKNKSEFSIILSSFNFQLQDVQITNIQNIEIFVISVQIYIKNVSIKNLVIGNGLMFNILSTLTVINRLTIQNCTFINTIFFDITAELLQLTEIVLENVKFYNSTLFLIQNKIDSNLEAKNVSIMQAFFNQSSIIYTLCNMKLMIINVMIINQSKFQNSQLMFIYQQLYNFYDENQKYIITNSSILESEFFVSNISIQTYYLQIDNFITKQSNITGLLLNLYNQYLIIQNMNFISCYFKHYEQKLYKKAIFDLESTYLIINGLYFSDITTYIRVIIFYFNYANITNIWFRQIQTYNSKAIMILGNQKSQDLHIINMLISNLYCNQPQQQNLSSLIYIKSNHFYILSTEIYNVFSNYQDIIRFDCEFIEFQDLIAQKITAYNMFYTATKIVRFKNLLLNSINIQQHIFVAEAQYFRGIIQIDGLEMDQSFIKNNIINVEVQETSLVKINNVQIFQIECEKLISILVQQLKFIQIYNIVISQSKLSSIYHTLGMSQYLEIHFIRVSDVEFDEYTHSLKISCNSLELEHIVITKVVRFNIEILFHTISVFQFAVTHSQIKHLGFYQFLQSLDSNISYNGLLLYNNTFTFEQFKGSLGLIMVGQEIFYSVTNLNIVKNQVKQGNYFLLELKGLINIQINMVDNMCQNQCINVLSSSKIRFDHFIEGNEFKNQLIRIDNTSIIESPQLISFNKSNFAIRINNRFVISNQQTIPLPSGQQLIYYQIYYKEKWIQYFNNIQIIVYWQNQDYVVQGQFTIQAFEFDVHQKKVIQDLNQFQSFNSFYQNESYSGLLYYQINFNPYKQNMIMIKIQQVGDLDQHIIIFAQTQVCQMGEILYQDQCLVCDPKLQIYSVQQKSNFCRTVDYLIISDHSKGAIKLRERFWRPHHYSSQIEQCEGMLSQCLGGWNTGDNSCKIGHMGGICKACDLYNIKGNGYYQQENSFCILCSEIQQYQYLFLKLLFVIFIYCLRIMFQINSNIQNQKKLVLQRLINYRNFDILVKYIQDLPPMIFKITLANLAFLRFIMQDFIDLPNIMTIFTNPDIIQNSSSTCLQLIINLNWSYCNLIIKALTPILTYNIFIIMAMISQYYKRQIKNILLYPILSLFFSQGPTILALFIQSTFNVNYSNIRYAYFDYSIRYFSHDHLTNLKYIILPIILLFSFVLPLIIYLILKKINKNLYKGYTFIIGGNFILPYKNTYYEIYDYFKNSILLIVLTLNDKFLLFYDKALIYIVIVYFEKQNKIHKLKKISIYHNKQGIWLICLLLSSQYLQQFVLPNNHVLYIMVSIFIFQSFNFYFNLIFISYKLGIYEALKNKKRILNYLGLNNYLKCLNYWKSIKLNYKDLIKCKQLKKGENNQIILQFAQSQQSKQSLMTVYQEIEMKEMRKI